MYTVEGDRIVVKLIDFSVSQKIDKIRLMKVPDPSGFHDHVYETPESLENRPLGSHTDMWHVGVLTYYVYVPILSETGIHF